MSRSKIIYSEEELNRNTHYILAFSGDVVSTPYASIPEAIAYIQATNRKVLVFSNNSDQWNEAAKDITGSELKTITPVLSMNFTTNEIKIADTAGRSVVECISLVASRYKVGMLILDKDLPLSPQDYIDITKIRFHGIDIVINKALLSEVSPEEIAVCTAVRVHAQPGFDKSKGTLAYLATKYDDYAVAVVFAQLIVNERYAALKKYVDTLSKEVVESDLFDKAEYYSAESTFVYFDFGDEKLKSCDKEELARAIPATLDSIGVPYNLSAMLEGLLP